MGTKSKHKGKTSGHKKKAVKKSSGSSRKQKAVSNEEVRLLRRGLEREQRQTVRLRHENIRLRRQLNEVQKRLEDQTSPSPALPLLNRKALANEPASSRLLRNTTARAESFSKRTYVGYLTRLITSSYVYRLFQRIYSYFRKLRLVRTILAIATVVLTATVISVVYVIVLPVIALLSALGILVGLLRTRRINRIMRSALAGKRIHIIVPPDEVSLKDDPFCIRSAREMATRDGCAVIVVSPHILSTEGLGGRGPYFTARREGENLYLVRRNYYFILRRRVLDIIDPRLTIQY